MQIHNRVCEREKRVSKRIEASDDDDDGGRGGGGDAFRLFIASSSFYSPAATVLSSMLPGRN